MSKSFKVAALVAVTAMFLTAPVFAPRVYAQSSPTSTATAGVFTGDVDDSMDVLSYSGVEFEKWFGFVGIDTAENYLGTAANVPSLGFATRFGSLYLGAWYKGNIASTNNTETQTVVSTYSLANQLLTQRQTTITYRNQYTDSNNSLNVLIGVAGMGIKVGFSEALRVWSYPGTQDANFNMTITEDATGARKDYTNDYIVDDYQRIQGWMIPSLEWGMSLAAGGITIKPYLGVDFGIYRNTNIFNARANYSTFNDEIIGTERINLTDGTVNDYLQPDITVGVGFDFSSGASVGIEYELAFDLYNNSYDGSGFKGTTAGTVSWGNATTSFTTIASSLATTTTTTQATLDIDEITNWEHSITPSFYYSKEIVENFNLGFYAEIPVGITLSSSNPYSEYHNTVNTEYTNTVQKPLGGRTETVRVTNDGLTETTTFSIGLNAAVGASYALFPGRFTINAGFGISPFTFTNTTTKFSQSSQSTTQTVKTYDADGNLINEVITLQGNPTTDQVTDRVTVANTWARLSVYAAGGFTFTFGENAALDMVVSGGTPSPTFTLNLTNVKVLLSLKF